MWCYIVIGIGKRKTLAEKSDCRTLLLLERDGEAAEVITGCDVEVWQEAACSGAFIHLPINN